MAFGPCDAALITTFGKKKMTDNFDRTLYLTIFFFDEMSYSTERRIDQKCCIGEMVFDEVSCHRIKKDKLN